MLSHYMQQLARELEQEGDYATEVPGVFAFPLEGGQLVTLSDLPEGFTLTANVWEAPEKQAEEFLTQMMFANLYGDATEGCVLGLDGNGQILTLSREVPYRVEFREFRDILEDFVNSVDFWREEAQSYTEETKENP